MRKKFVFATNNSHKLEEVTAILGEKVELLSMKDIKCDTDISRGLGDVYKRQLQTHLKEMLC